MIYAPYPFKHCTKCKHGYLPTKSFFYLDKRDGGLRAICKACESAIRRQYRYEHREQAKAQKHQVYLAHREEICAKTLRYKHEHPEQVRTRNQRYRAAHPEPHEQRRARGRRRYARQCGAEGSHTSDDVQAQLKRQKKRCYYCGEKLNGKYHVDHVIPLKRGGSDDPSNLVIACPFCNQSKHDRLPHEWTKGGRLL